MNENMNANIKGYMNANMKEYMNANMNENSDKKIVSKKSCRLNNKITIKHSVLITCSYFDM